jgi:hypothetical protein
MFQERRTIAEAADGLVREFLERRRKYFTDGTLKGEFSH